MALPQHLLRFAIALQTLTHEQAHSMRSIAMAINLSASQVCRNLHNLLALGLNPGIKIIHVTKLDDAEFTAYKSINVVEYMEKCQVLHNATVASCNTYETDIHQEELLKNSRVPTKTEMSQALHNATVEKPMKSEKTPHTPRIEYIYNIKHTPLLSPNLADKSKSMCVCIENKDKKNPALAETRTESNVQGLEVQSITSNTNNDISDSQAKKRQNGLQRKAEATEILDALNLARKSVNPRSLGIKPNSETLKHIIDRLEAGYTKEDCLAVIEVCRRESRKDLASFTWFNAVSPFRADNFVRKLSMAESIQPQLVAQEKPKNEPQKPLNSKEQAEYEASLAKLRKSLNKPALFADVSL